MVMLIHQWSPTQKFFLSCFSVMDMNEDDVLLLTNDTDMPDLTDPFEQLAQEVEECLAQAETAKANPPKYRHGRLVKKASYPVSHPCPQCDASECN
jgi:hypothetical protein